MVDYEQIKAEIRNSLLADDPKSFEEKCPETFKWVYE